MPVPRPRAASVSSSPYTSFRVRTPTWKTCCQSAKPPRGKTLLLARIVGTVVATRKDERLVSSKLLVVRPVDPHGKLEANYLVAIDTVNAGVGETVLVVSGSSARMAAGLKDCPVDAAIIGVIDHIEVPD
jgi:microcompartment protein CcmK/EutM